MNILITAAATAQAYQLQRLLKNNDNFLFADSVDLPLIMLRDKKFVKIPFGDSPSFAHLLLTICLDNQIEKVYPLRKAEVLALAEARQLFDEYGIRIMVPGNVDILSLLNKDVKGQLIIKDDSGTDGFPDRGVFLKNDTFSEFQLFTVD